MSKFNVFILCCMVIDVMSANAEQNKKKDEHICSSIVNVLCVTDILTDIAKAAKKVQQLATDIDNKIFQYDPTKLSLLANKIEKMLLLAPTFPATTYHREQIWKNNVERENFIHIIREEHYAISFIYQSIQNLHHTESTLGKTLDTLLNKTQLILRKDMFCNYVYILRVYLADWLSIEEINGIKLPKDEKRELSSFEYNTYAAIVVQLLINWTRSIESLLSNLTIKFMSPLTSLILVLLSINCVASYKLRRSQNDNMCTMTGSILCMKEELTIIETISKAISRQANEIIEIIEQIKPLDTLHDYIKIEVNNTQMNVPKTEYHMKFRVANNIDKEFLTNLFLEAHNAMIFFYNSVEDLLALEVPYAATVDKLFRRINYDLREEMICRYRRALYVFSQKWKSANEIERLNFTAHARARSMTHQVRSVVILRYLKEWVTLISYVIVNLSNKIN
ncbi:unnamed protein product [Rotaria magnacalcarata]|uniref:Uncharacterized protein n=1 Tax=Rotaria magnacalcarata TaxID=392030 RepID=A0A819MVU5_9BILA|nr:unnamed protein product [Rotaria magnacalcarata]